MSKSVFFNQNKLTPDWHKWLFFKNYKQLKREEKEDLDSLLVKYPLLDKVYELKNDFKILWEQSDKLEASAFLTYWADTIRTFKKKVLILLINIISELSM